MRYQNFITRFLSLAVIVGSLFIYNSIASERQELIQNNENIIFKVEAYNESIKTLENELNHNSKENRAESDADDSSLYANGIWEGTGIGFGGEIKISVTVKDGRIDKVEIISAEGEDSAYFNMAKVIADRIVEVQSTEVDTITGATYSSNGILDAAADALSKAVIQ